MIGWIVAGIVAAIFVAVLLYFGDVLWHMTFRG
jgi:hypothetical protein